MGEVVLDGEYSRARDVIGCVLSGTTHTLLYIGPSG